MKAIINEFVDRNYREIKPGDWLRNINAGTLHKIVFNDRRELFMMAGKDMVRLNEFAGNILAPETRRYRLLAFEITKKTVVVKPENQGLMEKEEYELERDKKGGKR
jgi:hypothetical protein